MGHSTCEIPILMYHRIGERRRDSLVRDQYVPLSLFERHLDTLKSAGYETISLDEMQTRFQSENGPKSVVLTFDDGYESFSTEAVPALRKRGMKATVFLVANCVGHTNRWDEAKGDVTERLMGWDQIRLAHGEGLEVGAHSSNHPDLRFCSDELAQREIAGCKQILEENLGFPVRWFSYPYGKNLVRERALVSSAGYAGATGTEKHTNTAATDPFSLGRLNMRATTSPRYLLHKLRKASHG